MIGAPAQRSLRRARWVARAPALVAAVIGLVLVLAGLRSLMAGPSSLPSSTQALAAPVDLAVHGFAEQFARRYLTFDGTRRGEGDPELLALAGAGFGADAGRRPPAAATQAVSWAAVVQDQAAIAGGRLVTVAAMIDRRGLVHLSVPVRRDSDGRLVMAGFPAFVGAPLSRAPASLPARRAVQDPELAQVAARAVGNYLAGDADDLLADLAPGADVALPAWELEVEGDADVTVAGPGGVLVTVRARDTSGAVYTLTYELAVRRLDRWYVTAVQTFPDQP